MPHQCTNCDRTFSDGSKEMLSGCPDCGGNKFQFKPEGSDSVDSTAEPPEPPEPTGSSVAQTVGKTAATVKDLMGSSGGEESVAGPTSGVDEPTTATAGGVETESVDVSPEDTAQASARTDVVAPDELPSEPTSGEEHHFEPVSRESPGSESDSGSRTSTDPRPTSDSDTSVAEEPSGTDRPGLDELREELNDQFESVKVVAPGQYELNLVELYEREEYIVALEEDGRYSIQVPENFRD